MTTKFSASAGVFYPPGIDFQSMPDDLIDVTDQEFQAAMSRQPDEILAVENGHVVVVPRALTIDQLKSAKMANLAAACREACEAGFTHNALGANHRYPTKPQDQANLTAVVTASLVNGAGGEPYRFWCADSDGVWARRDHSVAQIQQVGRGVLEMIRDNQDQYAALADAVKALPENASQAEFDAIQWSS